MSQVTYSVKAGESVSGGRIHNVLRTKGAKQTIVAHVKFDGNGVWTRRAGQGYWDFYGKNDAATTPASFAAYFAPKKIRRLSAAAEQAAEDKSINDSRARGLEFYHSGRAEG